MKITNQTADEMSLQDGNVIGKIVSLFIALFGLGLMYLPFSHVGVWSSSIAPVIVFLVGITLLAIGFAMFLFSSSIAMVINKQNGKINYQKKEVIGTKQTMYAISDVLRIETRKMWEAYGNKGIRWRLLIQSIILFKDGSELPIDNVSDGTGASLGRRVLTAKQANDNVSNGPNIVGPRVLTAREVKEGIIANQAAVFMGVPFQEIAPTGGATLTSNNDSRTNINQ